ncbi:MAG: PIG-L deacetylase family protein [Nitrospinota bacterium]
MRESRVEFRSILVVVAHPDDVELGAGGSVAKWCAGGAAVRLVVATNGDKGTKDLSLSPHRLAEMREAEQRRAAETLGVREVIFLRHRDGELEDTGVFRHQVAFLIRHYRPDTLLTHDPFRRDYSHPDHRAVGHGAFKAIISARDHHFLPELTHVGIGPHHVSNLLYMQSERPDFFVDIRDTIDRKLEAVGAHESQVHEPERMRARVLERASEWGRQGGLELAEGFALIQMR